MMSNDKTATERLRELLAERGVEWTENDGRCSKQTDWSFNDELIAEFNEWENGTTRFDCDTWCFSPEQAIEVTLGHEQRSESVWESDPVWERWLDGLKHDEIKTIGDAVEQLMYESIEHGGDMGPNGNTYGGIDEGDVATLGFINDWIDKFNALLENDKVEERETCTLPETRVDHGGIAYNGVTEWHKCSACGEEVLAFPAWYCPNCGAKVVD